MAQISLTTPIGYVWIKLLTADAKKCVETNLGGLESFYFEDQPK